MNDSIPFTPGEGVSQGPGAMLAKARKDAGLSVAEIASGLRYSVKQIEALEADDYPKLPGTTFVRGMMRGYAKLLKIPVEPIVMALDRRHIPSPVSVDLRTQKVPFAEPKERSNKVYAWLSLALVFAVVLIVAEWIFGFPAAVMDAILPSSQPDSKLANAQPQVVAVSQPDSNAPNADQPSLSNTDSAPLSTAPVGDSPLVTNLTSELRKLRFEFVKDAWIEVREASGRVLTSQVNLAGTKTLVEGQPPFSVIVGNASSVRMFNGDMPVELEPHTKVDVARFTLN